MTVRVRGIYTTALTALLDDIVQASPAIAERFEDTFAMEPASVSIETTADRQGVGLHGDRKAVADVLSTLRSTAIDTLAWRAALPRGGVFAGEVIDTLGSGAVVRCTSDAEGPGGAGHLPGGLAAVPTAGDGTGFLPYSKTSRRIEEGDRLRVQVTEPNPPWGGGRPVLDTTVRVEGGLATLIRGSDPDAAGPELADILPADPPEGWGLRWESAADDADLEELSAVIETLGNRADSIDGELADAAPPAETAPEPYARAETTCWVWFGRESRFALDEIRKEVTATMPGHHRTKAGSSTASTAVDFVEGVCAGESIEGFPFGAVTEQFGPREGDRINIGHGKPDGRLIELGEGEVTERTEDGRITLRREMSGYGTYDALGTEREAGDTAVTKFKEGRWWYPTVYRSESGESKGTYVNVCTPVEVFPDTVRYVDLHVDVIKHPDGSVQRVDGDELNDAVDAGEIPEELAEKARSVAAAVESALSG